MSALIEDREEPITQAPPALPRNEELVTLPRCSRCKLLYTPSKSSSALKLTYCSFLCELGDLGFSITGLETMVLKKRDEPVAALPASAPA